MLNAIRSNITYILLITCALLIVGHQINQQRALDVAGSYVVVHPDFENKTAMTLYDDKAYYLGSDCKVTEFSREHGNVVKEYPAPSYVSMESPVFHPIADMAKDLGLDCR